MAKVKGRAKQFQDPDEVIAKDYDPESNAPESDGASGSDETDGEDLATEHYVSVGKGKLRRKENVSLGPEYRGSRVSRSALERNDEDEDEDSEQEKGEDDDDDEESDYDDPDEADLEADEAAAGDSEIDSDDALEASDAERFKSLSFRGSSRPGKAKGRVGRPKAGDYMSDGEDEDEDGSGDDEDLEDGLDALVEGGGSDSEDDGSDGDEDSGGDDQDVEDPSEEEEEDAPAQQNGTPRPNLFALSNRADVDKGIAIQKQRKIYDGLLNLRIRLQKAIVAANSFPTVESESEAGAESEPYEAAEEAAMKLLNTISSLRENFVTEELAGTKRKRDVDVSMTSADIWKQLQEEDAAAVEYRGERLEKWSKKVQSVEVMRLNRLGHQSTSLISALQEQLMVPDNRLVRRTKVPRSCAPVQLSRKVAEDNYVYDDADFYQVLLKELVEQRTVEGGGGVGEQGGAVPTVMVTATKEVKVRKQVDRKASKGRKMRFTVHEKLQNFMAPEDRRSWEQGAIDRFFGTLFGRKMELNEERSEDEDEDEDMGGVDAEEEGLKLFRS